MQEPRSDIGPDLRHGRRYRIDEPPPGTRMKVQLVAVLVGVFASGFSLGMAQSDELRDIPILKVVGGAASFILFLISLVVRSAIWLFTHDWLDFPARELIPGLGVGIMALSATGMWLAFIPSWRFWSQWGILGSLLPGLAVVAIFGAISVLGKDAGAVTSIGTSLSTPPPPLVDQFIYQRQGELDVRFDEMVQGNMLWLRGASWKPVKGAKEYHLTVRQPYKDDMLDTRTASTVAEFRAPLEVDKHYIFTLDALDSGGRVLKRSILRIRVPESVDLSTLAPQR